MSDGVTRRSLLGAAATGAALAGCLGSSDDEGGASTDWRTASLTDVTTGESFTIGGFDRPVLLHTFAVWCSTCSRQHGEFGRLRESVGDDVVPVELNVDPNEDADAVREHAREGGYDWPFAVAPPEVTEALVEAFGSEVTSPPQSPVVLVCPDGSAEELGSSVVGAADLEAAIGDC